MSKLAHPQVGDIWYRVDGVADGDEMWGGGAELQWTEYKVVRVTPCGAWLSRPYGDFYLGKPRFALTAGCRWAHRTKSEALMSLARRKRLHLRFLERDTVVAKETLRLVELALNEAS